MNSLNLRQVCGGDTIKQADFGSELAFELLDEQYVKFRESLADSAKVILKKDNTAIYQKSVPITQNTVSFKFDKILPVGSYVLEIIVGDYVFPSNNRVIITVEQTYGDFEPEYLVKVSYEELKVCIDNLKSKVTALEERPIVDTALTERVEALERKEDKDTIYNDSAIVKRIESLEAREDKDTIYNDTEIKNRLVALERKEDKDTVYDDSKLVERIENLESDDTTIKERISALKDKPDKGTIYDDTSLKAKITELETALNTLVRKRPPMSFYIDRSDMSNMKAVFDNGCVMVNFPTSVYNYFYGYPGSHDGRSFHYYNLPGNLIKVAIGIVGIDSLKEEGISNAIYYCRDAKILNPIYDSSQFNFDELVIREPTDNKDFKLACQRNFVKIAYEIGALNESEIIKLGATKK